MKIEIDYNPVVPYTTLTVDHEIRDTIFGELFPVCNYPMQSWLKKRGAWNGLLKVLKDLSRRRSIELEFSGRTVDFSDVKEAVTDSDIQLTHIPKYEDLSVVFEDLSQLKKIMGEYPDGQVYEKFKADLEIDGQIQTLYIESMEDFQKNERIIRQTRQVVVISENIITQLQDTLDKIQFENFNRPDDSIVCMVDNNQAYYRVIGKLKRQYTVCVHGSNTLKSIEDKYNLPLACCNGQEILSAVQKWVDCMLETRKHLTERNEIIRKSISESENDDLEQEYDHNCLLLKWFRNNEKILLKYKK